MVRKRPHEKLIYVLKDIDLTKGFYSNFISKANSYVNTSRKYPNQTTYNSIMNCIKDNTQD